jgi:hypothetical protein
MSRDFVRRVSREGNRLTFRDRVDDQAVRDFLYALHDAVDRRGFQDVVLDFSACKRAYAEAMLPIVARTDLLASRGIGLDLVLPDDPGISRLFVNCNWAHGLVPDKFDACEAPHERHLEMSRYTTGPDQQQVVNAALDVVMRNMELSRDVLDGLEWSINEITDNVLNHAEAERGGFVQVSTLRESHEIHFVVADAGRGIPASMRAGAFPNLRTDADALMEAIKQGVTRSPDAGQGNGLAGTLRIATGSGGSFKLRSGCGELRVIKPPDATEYQHDSRNGSARTSFRGTVVSVTLRTDAEFGLEQLLLAEGIGHEPWDIIDAAYIENDDYLSVKLTQESGGFGTRQAGMQLRTKLKNLLAAEPSKRIVIDWAGVPLVSSSFADEAIGRLFVELGPMVFASRVQHVGMEQLVRSLVDQAVMQRVQQTTL